MMTLRRLVNAFRARWSDASLAGLLFLLLFPLCASNAFGQTFSASITGTVTDPSGAVIPGARVQLTNVATKDSRAAVTGGRGAYSFQNLLPGTYEIRASAQGFKEYVKTGLILRANTAANVDSQLATGNAQQQVVVS